LLALGVDPNRGDCSSSKDTPLIIAAQGIPWKDAVSKSKKDEATIIELLIAAGADVNGKNGNGRAPLAVAVYFGNREAIKVLIKHGAHLLPEEAVLRLQYGGFEPDQKRVALYGGALRELLDDKNLDKAIYRSIQDFLKVKVDINSLKIAIKYGNVNSVKSLLDVGLRLEDVDKETLMHPLSGCYHYNEKMVAFLIEQGFLLFSPAEVIKWRQGGGNVKAPDHFTARDYIDTLKRMLKDKNTSKKARQYAQNFLKGIEEQKKGLQRK
jgi:ankyrin repeat protein